MAVWITRAVTFQGIYLLEICDSLAVETSRSVTFRRPVPYKNVNLCPFKKHFPQTWDEVRDEATQCAYSLDRNPYKPMSLLAKEPLKVLHFLKIIPINMTCL